MTTTQSRGPATIQDVADRAGVSRAAVSKVIRNAYGVSPAMRERVGIAIEELDYRPNAAARSLRGASFTIGIELPGIGNPFFAKIIDGASSALAGSTYQLIVAPATSDREEGLRAIGALADRQVDGLIVISPLVQRTWLERVASRIPTVMLGRHDETEVYDTVTGDDLDGTAQVMRHLFELGHQRIAHLTVREEVTTAIPENPHAIRLGEYGRLMADAGFAPQLVRAADENGAYQRGLELLRRSDRPTAIFAGNDALALPLLRARADAGLTVADVSVVGYDNIGVAELPGVDLTTVDQAGLEMGSRSIELLLERIAGRTEPARHTTRATLRVRGSTAPAP
ncbi:LacI family DNA-binding transcriptional regulator [Microbacteriaceae bacterium VKM Ac-2855]|nr:LacI family DNA-binding transcriptional regulator [Microbacteriaceae bacterium VKM Ac-2855]